MPQKPEPLLLVYEELRTVVKRLHDHEEILHAPANTLR